MSEAFVYEWTDKATAKKYIGYHRGSLDDGYVCSSKSVLLEYRSRPEDFSRRILFTGSLEESRAREIEILKSLNAASNPEYYNLNNGGYHIVFTDEVRRKMSDAKKGKPSAHAGMKRRSASPEARRKISIANTGKIRSAIAKERYSKAARMRIPRTGWKQSSHQKSVVSEIFAIEVECPHCGKFGKKGNMIRWHFANCKVLAN